MRQEIKQLFRKIPVVYPLWHGMRLKMNETREKKKKEAFDKYAMDVLADIMNMTTAKGYSCFCYCGTLLGLVRDGHLIPWDDDLDLAILEEPNFSWGQFEKDMLEAGFWKYRKFESDGMIRGQSYKKKNVLCDFCTFPADGTPKVAGIGCDEIPGYVYENGKPGSYQVWDVVIPGITGISTIKKDGVKIKIPSNSEDVLVAIFGEGWKYPDPNFVPASEEKEKEYTFTYYRKPLFK